MKLIAMIINYEVKKLIDFTQNEFKNKIVPIRKYTFLRVITDIHCDYLNLDNDRDSQLKDFPWQLFKHIKKC